MKQNRYDILTEINLKEIIENKNQLLYYHLLDENGNCVHDDYESTISSELLVDYMVDNRLIKRQGEYCIVIKDGLDIYNSGGWLKYIKKEKQNSEKQNSKEIYRQNLKDEIDKLNYESLKHKETIREQEDRIRNLNEQLTLINLMKAYWWVIGIGFTIGGILGGIIVKML